MNIWVDIVSPPHALFFNSLLKEFDKEKIHITVRDKAETIGLVNNFGLKGKIVGKDYRNVFKKTINTVFRAYQLHLKVSDFDYTISFENGMSIAVSKFRRKKSILLCDNDLKFIQRTNSFMDIENKIKLMADFIIVPKACYESFCRNVNDKKKIFTYNGFKEDIYIADFKPDLNFKHKIPFEDFIVIRPEALGSLYVIEKQSIVPNLLKKFIKENINVVYLPREKEDFNYSKGLNVFIPDSPLNGLDLCYYSNAILTGSGTMGREAACLGKPAVSFFPGKKLLSVDKELIEKNKMIHSRDPEEIVNYVLSHENRLSKSVNLQRSKNVKMEGVRIIEKIINSNSR
jgi:predicted glycosyltransferase